MLPKCLSIAWVGAARAALRAVPEQQLGPEATVQQRLQATLSRLGGVLQHLHACLAKDAAEVLERWVLKLLTDRSWPRGLVPQLRLSGLDIYGDPRQGCLPLRHSQPLEDIHRYYPREG